MLRLVCLLLLLSPSGCFVVVVDANGNNSNPFLDGGGDGGVVRRDEPRPTNLAAASKIVYISDAR